VSNRKKFEELCDVKNVEMGIVKVPPELLNDLIHNGRIENYYDIDPIPVASGLFATVRKCRNKETGVEYAAKFSSRLRCGVDCTTEVLHEIALLSICAESSKIVHLKDVFQSKHEIVLVLEYAPGGDFQSVLDDDMVPFEQDVQGFIVQLLEALSYIHHRNIAHLDIKPQNIVLMSEFPNCEIKLCDLEVSRVIRDTEHIREIIGTPDYVAPEILGMDPISLAADIWSLGVLAYVLLTGFSPFGGDTDQETLRNITTAPLDFPAELFEGVSDDAKNFITQCLHRSPKKRPTVEECLQHPWISQNAEPPSPSPLMLKIPAPDHFVSPQPRLTVDHSASGDEPTAAGARRSCQTCRDKITERKRYLSKSREAIFEKVSNSNLKKSLSKSRERLCDMRLTLSKSRDYLNETKIASRHQEKFNNGFKSLSKSQEVLSQALGGNMKRMVNGAVSDISPSHLPLNPRVYLDSPDNGDFVILPGSSVLMSHSDLMSLSSGGSSSGRATGSTSQLESVAETSGRAVATVTAATKGKASTSATSLNGAGDKQNDLTVSTPSSHGKTMVDTLLEEEEEDLEEEANNKTVEPVERHMANEKVILRRDRDSRSCEASSASQSKLSRRKSSYEARGAMTAKEEKNSINYETKQGITRSASADGINKNAKSKQAGKSKSQTAEVAVQVNLPKSSSSPDFIRKERWRRTSDSRCHPPNLSAETASEVSAGNTRPTTVKTASTTTTSAAAAISTEKRLRRGFSHDDTLGEENKRYSWREELERFRNMKKPLAVSDLIDTFSNKSNTRKVSADDPSFSNIDSLKNRRRGSLQIQINPKELASLSERVECEKMAAKLQRRKSTSAILPVRTADVKMPDIAEDGSITSADRLEQYHTKDSVLAGEKMDNEKEEGKNNESEQEKVKKEVGVEEEEEQSEKSSLPDAQQNSSKASVYLDKVTERKRTWDYFEINHPKAISDKKLEQLKAKYTRRKTDTNLAHAKSCDAQRSQQASRGGDASQLGEGERQPSRSLPPTLVTNRTQSVPLIKGVQDIQRKAFDLAWDPITGESVNIETESVDSGKGGESSREQSICSTEDGVRKVSVNSNGEEHEVDPDAARNKKNSLISQLSGSEEVIPVEKVLQCFIDPFTGQFITSEVARPVKHSHNGNSDPATSPATNSLHRQADVPQSQLQEADDGQRKGRGEDATSFLSEPSTDSNKVNGSVSSTDSLPSGADNTGADAGMATGATMCLHQPADTKVDWHGRSIDESGEGETERHESDSPVNSCTLHNSSNSSNSNSNSRRGPAVQCTDSQRQRSNSGARERAKANKVCTGSFSRGVQRFRSESPVPSQTSQTNQASQAGQANQGMLDSK